VLDLCSFCADKLSRLGKFCRPGPLGHHLRRAPFRAGPTRDSGGSRPRGRSGPPPPAACSRSETREPARCSEKTANRKTASPVHRGGSFQETVSSSTPKKFEFCERQPVLVRSIARGEVFGQRHCACEVRLPARCTVRRCDRSPEVHSGVLISLAV
jgi:hypothetical protein